MPPSMFEVAVTQPSGSRRPLPVVERVRPQLLSPQVGLLVLELGTPTASDWTLRDFLGGSECAGFRLLLLLLRFFAEIKKIDFMDIWEYAGSKELEILP